MEMDRTSGKETYITQMSRTSREVDLTRKCIVRRRRGIGSAVQSAGSLPFCHICVFFCGFSSASRLSFKSSIV